MKGAASTIDFDQAIGDTLARSVRLTVSYKICHPQEVLL
jgi:hypothetical protein